MRKKFLIVWMVLVLVHEGYSQQVTKDERMEWWREARLMTRARS